MLIYAYDAGLRPATKGQTAMQHSEQPALPGTYTECSMSPGRISIEKFAQVALKLGVTASGTYRLQSVENRTGRV